MPPLVSNRVDDQAVALFGKWISGLKPDRPFVRAWKMEELAPLLDRVDGGRSAERGRTLFRETGCIQCHRLGGDGGTVGPELDGLAGRLGRREILESIVEPSKVVADAYAAFLIATNDGSVHSGRIEREDDSVVVLRPAPPAEPVTIAKDEIAERRRSEQSNMPAGMLNVLHEDEVLDLLAFAELHDRALAELLFDLGKRGLQGLGLFAVEGGVFDGCVHGVAPER